MLLDSIIHEFILDKQEYEVSSWMNTENVTSKIYKSEYFYKIRLSCVKVKNKFYAESLVIYPNTFYESPIFGTEYMNIANKSYFGAIDFHPLKNNNEYCKNYVEQYLEQFPNKKIEHSKYYDLDKFFSNHLWVKKQKQDLINEYQILLKCYLYQYLKCVNNSNTFLDSSKCHYEYNKHMGENDPVAGILKSYFGEEFSKKYIKEFLFPY